MHLEGEQQFDAPVETVWEVSFTPSVLEAAIPGAQSVTQPEPDRFEGVVERGLASVSIRMELEFDLVEDDRPERVVLEMEGSDNRTNSTAEGELVIEAESTEEGTLLRYEADIHFSGRLASLGGRLIKRQIKKDLSTFFEALSEELSAASDQPA